VNEGLEISIVYPEHSLYFALTDEIVCFVLRRKAEIRLLPARRNTGSRLCVFRIEKKHRQEGLGQKHD
jgi:hypothetical protein